jgi:aminoglycoside phosphotransferase (APT) family kinase protein
VLRTREIVEQALSPEHRRNAGNHLIDVFATLHNVDVDAVGLGDLARREAYVSRQLKRWHSQYEQSSATSGLRVPAIDEVHGLLASRVPEQSRASIVHGDYRLDNAVVSAEGDILAVLDWELCTLGDPLADFAHLYVSWSDPGDGWSTFDENITSAEGFPTRDEIRARYEKEAGAEIANFDYYVVFAYWKIACILAGVYARYAAGDAAGDRRDHSSMPARIRDIAEVAKNAATFG